MIGSPCATHPEALLHIFFFFSRPLTEYEPFPEKNNVRIFFLLHIPMEQKRVIFFSSLGLPPDSKTRTYTNPTPRSSHFFVLSPSQAYLQIPKTPRHVIQLHVQVNNATPLEDPPSLGILNTPLTSRIKLSPLPPPWSDARTAINMPPQ